MAVQRWSRALILPASGATMGERGLVRAVLSLTTALLVLGLGLLAPSSRSFEVTWAVVAALLGASSLSSRVQPLWDRLGGLTAIVAIAVLVAGTGGLESPYHLLYLINGVFGAAYYPRRRLVVETLAMAVALAAPVVYDPAPDWDGVGEVVVALAVFVGAVTFVWWLVGRLRSSEQERLSAETRYASAFEASPLPIVTLDVEGTVESVNPAFLDWSGFARDQVIGRSFLTFVAEEDLADARATFSRARSGEALHGERRVVDAHGRRRDVVTTTLPLASGGRQVGVWSLLRDVTGASSPSEALRSSEERFRRLVDNLPVTVYYAPPGYYRSEEPLWFISPNVAEWLGYPTRSWLADPVFWRRIVHHDDVRRVVQATSEAHAQGRPRRIEYRVVAADGQEHWVLDQAHPVPGPQHEPGWVQGVLLDITAEKRAERELAERARIQQELAGFAKFALRAEAFDELATRGLAAAKVITGSSAATLYFHVGDELEPAHSTGWPDDRTPRRLPTSAVGAVAGALRGGLGEFDPAGPLAGQGFRSGVAVDIGRGEGRRGVLVVHDTEPRTYSQLQRDALRVLAGSLTDALARDTTLAQLQASEARAEAHAGRLQAMIDASPLPIVEVDADGTILHLNRAAQHSLGVRPSDVGRPLGTRLEGIAPALEHLIESVADGHDAPTVEIATRTGRGDDAILQLHAGRRTAEDGARDAVIFFVDVTERRALESHMAQVDKMEALGRLTGGIAHDFNNLLTVIRSYAELAASESDPAAQRADLTGIVEVTEQGAELVDSFLGLARDEDVAPEPVALAGAIRQDQELYQRALPAGVRLVVDAVPVPPVLIAPAHLRRILLNLVTNAGDAFEGRPGEVLLRTSSDGETVTLVVADEGVGMDPATASRMFEPFFTTKAPRGGTGLGMFTVYRLAARYGARVEAASEPGKGTEMRLILPAAPSAVSQLPPREVPAAQPHATTPGTVLVVEDDDRVRELTERVLVRAGHHVRAVASAEEALDVLATGPVDVLLSDVVLPGIDGVALADIARQRRPGIAVILMSGHVSQMALRDGITVDQLDLLTKPFTTRRLLERVAEALSR